MDKVYVIYFDNKMYKTPKRKIAYLEEKYAEQVVTAESKEIAESEYDVSQNDYICWYDLKKEKQNELIQKVKDRFEIKIFIPQ